VRISASSMRALAPLRLPLSGVPILAGPLRGHDQRLVEPGRGAPYWPVKTTLLSMNRRRISSKMGSAAAGVKEGDRARQTMSNG
jgi:hypothetical protein